MWTVTRAVGKVIYKESEWCKRQLPVLTAELCMDILEVHRILFILSSHFGHTRGWKGEKEIWAIIKSSLSKPRLWAQVYSRANSDQAEAEGVHRGDPLAPGEARHQSGWSLEGTAAGFYGGIAGSLNLTPAASYSGQKKALFGAPQ